MSEEFSEKSLCSSILIYDSEVTGHHTDYLKAVYAHACSSSEKKVHFFVPHKFASFIDATSIPEHISFRYHTQSEIQEIGEKNLFYKSLFELRLVAHEASRQGIDEVFFMYMDYLQVVLGLPMARKLKFQISGIVFHPYVRILDSSRNNTFLPKIWMKGVRKKFQFLWMLRNKNIIRICVPADAVAVDKLGEAVPSSVMCQFLPEPYITENPIDTEGISIANKYSIEANRSIVLIFGSIIPRKNTDKIIKSIQHMDKSERKTIAFLILGIAQSPYKEKLKDLIRGILKEFPEIQIVFDCRFVEMEVIEKALLHCDVVAMPYLNVFHSSGVFFLAARFNKPVIVSDVGLISEFAVRYQLGCPVNATDSQSIAHAIKTLLSSPNNTEARNEFLQQHTPEKHAAVILNYCV